MRSRRLKITVLSALATLAAVPTAALAWAPDAHVHDSFTQTFSDQVCGVDVDGQTTAVINVFFDAEQNFRATSSFKTLLTNPATGRSVLISSAGHGVGPAPIIDEDAGTATFLSSFRGLDNRIQTDGGPVLLKGAGILGYQQVFDLQTGEQLSMKVVIDKGQHPGADGERFCEVVTQALA